MVLLARLVVATGLQVDPTELPELTELTVADVEVETLRLPLLPLPLYM